LKIADLRPSTKPIQAVKFIVLEKGPVQVIHATDEAKNQVEIPICTALVADETACCHFQVTTVAPKPVTSQNLLAAPQSLN